MLATAGEPVEHRGQAKFDRLLTVRFGTGSATFPAMTVKERLSGAHAPTGLELRKCAKRPAGALVGT